MNNIENSICDAIDILVKEAINSANFDKTIQATIITCSEPSTGEYLVKYQDSKFYAYASNPDITYNSGALVHLLIPEGDFSNHKTIIGAVKNLGANYNSQITQEDQYNEIGNNCVKLLDNFAGWSLCSYESPEMQVIYDRNQENNEGLSIDNIGLQKYISENPNTTHIVLGATIQTDLPQEQQNASGNYGIIYRLAFLDKTGVEVTRDYIVDVNSMTGNPYRLFSDTEQYGIFEIDRLNFVALDKIIIFSGSPSFIQGEEGKKCPKDIFIHNLKITAAERIPTEELNSYNFTILTPQGTYFNSEVIQDKQLIAQLKEKGKVLSDSKSLYYYWFEEQGNITSSDIYEYNSYGGKGWKCLNSYTIVPPEVINGIEVSPQTIKWIPASSTLTIKKSNLQTQTKTYKCVVVYNNNILSKEIVITNYDALYNIIIENKSSNEETAILECKVFKRKLNSNNHVIYNEDGTPQEEDITNQQNFHFNWSFKDDTGYYETLTESAQTITVNKSSFNKFRNYKCMAFTLEESGFINYYGTSSYLLTKITDELGLYSLHIINGEQLFKYNENGISPCHETLENPQLIPELSFYIYNNQTGQIINAEQIAPVNAVWTVPAYHTLLIPIGADKTLYEVDKETGEIIKTPEVQEVVLYGNSISYSIESRYNLSYAQNNNIQLSVFYDGYTLLANTSLTFIKEGESGTNGTDYICQIVPNKEAFKTEDPLYDYTYPPLVLLYNGEIQENFSLNRPWFMGKLWKNGICIFSNYISGEAIPENEEQTSFVYLNWEMVHNNYGSSIKETSHYLIDSSSGVIDVNLKEKLNSSEVCDIIKATFLYNDNTYYAFLPVSTANLINKSYNIEIKQNSGFRYVVYNSKGQNPRYNNESPFALNVYKDNQNITMDCTFSWSILGSTYSKEEGWKDTHYLQKDTYSTDVVIGKNEYFVTPKDFYDGYCVTNAVYCEIKYNDGIIGEVHIPIHFSLNQFGISAINAWDGNSIKLDDENGAILAPQMGAGEKDENNKFTGVVMGSVVESGNSQKETGLFAYSKGTRSFFLDANNGSAIFGTPDSGQIIIDPQNYRDDGKRVALIKSGNFNYNTSKDEETGQPKGTGLEIDLSTPRIRFGSGNFQVNEQGILTCKGSTIRGFLDVKTKQGSSVTLTEEEMKIHFVEYQRETEIKDGKEQYAYDKFGNPIFTKNIISETLIQPGEFLCKTNPYSEFSKNYPGSSLSLDKKTRKLRLQGELKISTKQGSISFCDDDMNINFYTPYNKNEEDDLKYPYLIGQKKNDFKITPTQFSLKGYEYNKEKNENKVKSKLFYNSNSGMLTLRGSLQFKTEKGTINISDNAMSFRFHDYTKLEDGTALKKTDFALSPTGFSFVGYGKEEEQQEEASQIGSITSITNSEGEIVVNTDGAYTFQSDILDSEGMTDSQKEYYEELYLSQDVEESSDYNEIVASDSIPTSPEDKVIETPEFSDTVIIDDKTYKWKEISSLKYNTKSGKLRLNGDFTLKNDYGSVTLTDQLLRISFKNPVPGDPTKILNRMCISQSAFYFYGYGDVPYKLSEDAPIQYQWGVTSGISYSNGTLKVIGEINATSGIIGGWKIDDTSLVATNGSMVINSDGTISGLKGGGVGGNSASGQITSESEEEKTVITDGQISFYRMMESPKYPELKQNFDKDMKNLLNNLIDTLKECGYKGTVAYNKKTGKITTPTKTIIANMNEKDATKAKNAINKYNNEISIKYKELEKAHILDWREEGRIYTNDRLTGSLRGGLCLSSYDKRPLCFSVGNQLVAEFLPKETVSSEATEQGEGEERNSANVISPAFFAFVSRKLISQDTSNQSLDNESSSNSENENSDSEGETQEVLYKQTYGTQLYKDKITTPNIELQSRNGVDDLLTINKTIVGALNEINSYPDRISYEENITDSKNNFIPSENISYDRIISEWSHKVYKYEPVYKEETAESKDEDKTKEGMATPEYRTNTTLRKEILTEQRSFILQVKDRGKSTEEVTKIIRQKNPSLGWNEDVEIQLSGFNI